MMANTVDLFENSLKNPNKCIQPNQIHELLLTGRFLS